MELSTDTDCQICQTSNSRYSCPKCNVRYCSVDCYRSEKHMDCSEAFYQTCVQEELRNTELDPESKRKMLEILKSTTRYEDESDGSLDSDDLDSEPDLVSRMKDVNLEDGDTVWDKLTPEEKREFRKCVATGDIMKIVPDWEPWWETARKKTIIQDCDKEDFNWKENCPHVPAQIPNLSSLTKSKPSPCIPHMVLNILSSYTCTVRWFKGLHLEMPVESASSLIALSETLRSNKVFTNPVEGFVSFEENVSKCSWSKLFEYQQSIVSEDLKTIIRGQYRGDRFFFIKAALSDIDETVTEAIKALKNPKTSHLKRFTGDPPSVTHLRLISKKMAYYLSWTASQGDSLVDTLNNYS